MKLVCFCVKDNATQSFQVPQYVAHIGGAVRWFGDRINDDQSPFSAHPDDYDLYEVGSFEDQDGVVSPQKPEIIVRGKDLVRPKA